MNTQTIQTPKEEFMQNLFSALDWGVERVYGEVEGKTDIWEQLDKWEKLAQEDSENDDGCF